MPHIDPELLALLALGERAAAPGNEAHLAECPECAEALVELAAVTRIGRESLGLGPLAVPSPEVWAGVAAELGLERPSKGRSAAGARRRSFVPLLAAAAAVVLIVGGAVAAWQLLRPVVPTVLASATLDAFPDWPTASGRAFVESLPDGERVVRIDLDAPPAAGEYREAWLITTDASALLSLGVVDSETATLVVPAGVDLSEYNLVDVSAESFDGDPAHSGDSIVRGRLR